MIKSCRKSGKGNTFKDDYRIIKGTVEKSGYVSVPKRCNSRGKVGSQRLSRLVARYFVPPYEGEVVRHMDDNPLNNDASNLQWGTQKDNIQDCIAHGRYKNNMTKELNELGRRLAQPHNESIRVPVKATNIYTGEVRYFESLCEASEKLKVAKGSIGRCVRNPDKDLRAGDWHFERSMGNEC